MLTLAECKKLIDPKHEKYTDKELERKLRFLTALAETIIQHVQNEQGTGQRKTRSADGAGIE